jgi:two-component system, sensor histidine kinase and response regulator
MYNWIVAARDSDLMTIPPLENYDEQVPRLLIVDDNEVNRILLERLFRSQGYQTDSAVDGQAALQQLQAHPFDIVLMDIMMPVMDGLTALEHIRASEDTASLPVVLISAMSDADDIVRGLELGANDYITKPVDMEIAIARVKTQITLKLLMDERKATIQRMEESQKMRDQFFRMASHDLKGPLTNLRVSQMLMQELVDANNDKAHRILETMRITINSMTQVVEDFLDTSAMQSGEIDIKLEAVSVLALLRDIIAQQTPYAHEKNIQIAVDNIHGTVKCDPARTAQVINNLLSNAIKYSEPGTMVRVWTSKEDGGVRIFVADEGPGIPEQERVRLFQPFGKLSTQPTGGESSHGLGLWIAKHLIDLQDGAIGVTCPPSGGSVFWVALPSLQMSRS